MDRPKYEDPKRYASQINTETNDSIDMKVFSDSVLFCTDLKVVFTSRFIF